MDCSVARKILSLSCLSTEDVDSPRNLGEALAHARDCSTCSEVLHSQQVFDDRIAGAMHDVPVPAGLKERLLASIQPVLCGSATAPPTQRRRQRLLTRMAACVAAATVAAGIWWMTAMQTRPRQLDLAVVLTRAAALLAESGGQVSLASLPPFEQAFDLGTLTEWSRTVELRGVELDGRRGQDAAATLIRIGSGPQANGIVLMIPAKRVRDASVLASHARVSYSPVAHAAWRSGEFIFVCYTTQDNFSNLEHYAARVAA
jgi:hypothetical protein